MVLLAQCEILGTSYCVERDMCLLPLVYIPVTATVATRDPCKWRKQVSSLPLTAGLESSVCSVIST